MASSTSVPGRDVESHQLHQRTGHFALLFDQAGVTQDILDYKYSGEGTEENPYLADFIPDDPKNPMAFKFVQKWSITVVQAISVLAVTFASSSYSGGIVQIIEDFECSTIVATLGISLFVTGFAFGPLIWAPLSELYGRQVIFFSTFMGLTVFLAGSAGAKNIETLIVLRFFAGFFGSAPLTNSGGVIADMFPAEQRGRATAIFATAPFLGPSLGPVAGGFLAQSAGWRWNEGLMTAFCGVVWIMVFLAVPETYAPALLRRRAEKLQKLTGKVYISKVDAGRPRKTPLQEFQTALSRPWILLFLEPIVLLTTIYMAIIYGTLYMMFGAFPIVFEIQRGWSQGVAELPFIGVAIGMLSAVFYYMWDNNRYARLHAAKGKAEPEDRLPSAMIGSILLPVGLFWFAWTNGLDVHWIVCIIAAAFFGAGLVLVFLSLMNYLVDTYVIYAASVLAANSILRSLFGAAFPLFTPQMFDRLGIHWASSIPAFLALACVPCPFLFYKYGHLIRMKCKFAAEAAHFLERMRAGAVTKPAAPAVAAEKSAEEPGSRSGVIEGDDETVVESGSDENEAGAPEKEHEAQGAGH